MSAHIAKRTPPCSSILTSGDVAAAKVEQIVDPVMGLQAPSSFPLSWPHSCVAGNLAEIGIVGDEVNPAKELQTFRLPKTGWC
jgi:hypothetical protein